jgi:hypothetical protein
MSALRPAVFYFPDSDSGDRWAGWWHGVRWNGWAVPYFDRATMIEILLTMGRVERREEPGDDGGLAVLSDDEQTLLEFWPMHVEGVEVNVYLATGLCVRTATSKSAPTAVVARRPARPTRTHAPEASRDPPRDRDARAR